MCFFSILKSLHCFTIGPYDNPKWNKRILENGKITFFQGSPLWKLFWILKIANFQCIYKLCCSFLIFWDTDIPNMLNQMVLQANVRFGWGMAPSPPPPPPPCWVSRCSWRSPWSLQQFSESPSIFSSNICMRFNLRYCFWLSDNKQRNYTQCYTPLVNSWWWSLS